MCYNDNFYVLFLLTCILFCFLDYFNTLFLMLYNVTTISNNLHFTFVTFLFHAHHFFLLCVCVVFIHISSTMNYHLHGTKSEIRRKLGGSFHIIQQYKRETPRGSPPPLLFVSFCSFLSGCKTCLCTTPFILITLPLLEGVVRITL